MRMLVYLAVIGIIGCESTYAAARKPLRESAAATVPVAEIRTPASETASGTDLNISPPAAFLSDGATEAFESAFGGSVAAAAGEELGASTFGIAPAFVVVANGSAARLEPALAAANTEGIASPMSPYAAGPRLGVNGSAPAAADSFVFSSSIVLDSKEFRNGSAGEAAQPTVASVSPAAATKFYD